jgi:hypothetical protein
MMKSTCSSIKQPVWLLLIDPNSTQKIDAEPSIFGWFNLHFWTSTPVVGFPPHCGQTNLHVFAEIPFQLHVSG